VAAELEAWDLRATADSRAAAHFYAWYEAVRRGVQASLFTRGGWAPGRVVNMVLDSASLGWLPHGPQAFDSLMTRTSLEAHAIAEGKTWGELHSRVAEHPLAAAPALERMLGLNVGPAAAGGSPTTVNVSHYNGPAFPVLAAYGPSQRHVVDMADVDGAGGFILPTGQSGLPFDEHYRDQWDRWLHGGLWRIPLASEAAEARAVQRLRLRPAEPGG
jgi:penicillin amidase